MRNAVDALYMDDKIKRYIVDIVHATRKPEDFGLKLSQYSQYGASPRATINLALASKAQAFLDSRGYVTPQDIKTIAYDVLRHRIIVSYEAEAEDVPAEKVLKEILDHLKVP
jgi:MoxR-like ATPase